MICRYCLHLFTQKDKVVTLKGCSLHESCKKEVLKKLHS